MQDSSWKEEFKSKFGPGNIVDLSDPENLAELERFIAKVEADAIIRMVK